MLWIKSPTLMVGYWNNPSATAETIRDGWLNTSDAMRFDDDVYHWFCDRRKQIIVHDGSNICPQDVEETLMEHPAVDQAGVIGIEDAVHGQKCMRMYPSNPDVISPEFRTDFFRP